MEYQDRCALSAQRIVEDVPGQLQLIVLLAILVIIFMQGTIVVWPAMKMDLDNRELTVLFVTQTVLVAVGLLQLNALLAILESIYIQQITAVFLAT